MSADEQGLEGQLNLPPVPSAGAEGQPQPWQETDFVGARQPRVDGYQRAIGSAVFPSDLILPGMVYAAVLGCPHAHARVRGVDLAAAEALPSVHAAIGYGGKDNPDWPYSGEHPGQLFDAHCRFEGDAVAAVAAVAAETPYAAHDGLRAIRVEYQPLPAVSSIEAALADGAAKVHPGGNQAGSDRYSRGDVEQGFAQADVVIEQVYGTASEMQIAMCGRPSCRTP